MLTLYALLIFALGSSVMAMPMGQLAPRDQDQQPYGEARLLQGNTDKRLTDGLWGRAIPTTSVKLEQAWLSRAHWTFARDCDDFIQFFSGLSGHGVETMTIHRVMRKVEGSKMYIADQKDGKTQMEAVHDQVPSTDWITYLDNRYWTREPDIVGQVSDGVSIWKS